jgi:hypothetical protein
MHASRYPPFIGVLDRSGLEAAACPCYAAIRKTFERLNARITPDRRSPVREGQVR